MNTDPKTWRQSSRDRYHERVAIMREANRIPVNVATPKEIVDVATAAALAEERAIDVSEVPLQGR